MGAEKLDKKRSGALVGGIFLILAVPVCGIQVPVQAFFFLAWIYVILFLEANSYSWNELQEGNGLILAQGQFHLSFFFYVQER